MSAAATITAYCRAQGYPEPEAEHRFARPRLYKFDYAWPDESLAMEIEGGIYGKGKPCPACGRKSAAGHTGISRLKSDMEKYNLAAFLGWRLVRCRPEQVESGEVFGMLDRMFCGESA